MAKVAVQFRLTISVFWTSCILTGTVQAEDRRYIVLAGDSLSKILHKHGISVEDLYSGGHWLERNKRRNSIVTDWHRLKPGTPLTLELPDYLSPKRPSPESPTADSEVPFRESPINSPYSIPTDPSADKIENSIPEIDAFGSEHDKRGEASSEFSASYFLEQSILMQKSASRGGVRINSALPLSIDLGIENSSPLVLASSLGNIRINWLHISLGLSTEHEFDAFRLRFGGGLLAERNSVSIPLQNTLGQTTRKKVSSSGAGVVIEGRDHGS